MESQIRYLVLFLPFSVIDSFGWFWMGSLHKNMQLMLKFLKAPFLVLYFSYYTLMTFLMMLSVILISMLMILLSCKCDQASDMRQHLELASELESDLQDTVDRGRKWLVYFKAGKTQLVSFDQSNNTGAGNVKMDGSVFEEKSFKMLGWLSLLNWIGALTLSVLPKLLPRILEPWFVLWSFFLLRLLCISVNVPYGHAWNTVVTSKLVLQAANQLIGIVR